MPTSPTSSASTLERPVPATIAAVIHEGRVLLVRRKYPPDIGLWAFPGGKIELGEGVETAALRELFEETGISGKACGVFTAVDVIDRDDAGALRFHYILIGVLCRWESGAPVAGDDALEARWFALHELDGADLAMSFGVADIARQAAGLLL